MTPTEASETPREQVPSIDPVADESGRCVLVTGYPSFVASRLAVDLVRGGDRVSMLCRQKYIEQAQVFAAETNKVDGAASGGRVEAVLGDILDIDIGLSGRQVTRFHEEVDEIHHIAAFDYLGQSSRKMRLLNVEGLREVLELALGMRRLKRVCHWSTAFVAGDRVGVAYEHELDVGQRFHNDFERTKTEGEALARVAMADVPLTVVRPSIVVGDSNSGEIGHFDGAYLLINAIVNAPSHVAVPLPSVGRFPFNVVPADYVVRAARHLARHPDAVGGTFHLVDSAPLNARGFFNAVADAAGQQRPRVVLPGSVARTVLRLPGIRQLARRERTFVEWFDSDLRFDDQMARRLLSEGGIECPPVASYVDVLVRFVREFAS